MRQTKRHCVTNSQFAGNFRSLADALSPASPVEDRAVNTADDERAGKAVSAELGHHAARRNRVLDSMNL